MAHSNTFILLILWMIIIMIGTSNTGKSNMEEKYKCVDRFSYLGIIGIDWMNTLSRCWLSLMWNECEAFQLVCEKLLPDYFDWKKWLKNLELFVNNWLKNCKKSGTTNEMYFEKSFTSITDLFWMVLDIWFFNCSSKFDQDENLMKI